MKRWSDLVIPIIILLVLALLDPLHVFQQQALSEEEKLDEALTEFAGKLGNSIQEVNIVDQKGEAIDFSQTKQGNTFELSLESVPIKKIVLNGVRDSAHVDLRVDFFESETMVQAYAIDPTVINFTKGRVTVLAKGDELYKCKDWNFAQRQCNGYWVKMMDIRRGELYSFILTPDDPGFGEIYITRANHLDENRRFISDIYDSVKELDDVWSETIQEDEYVRVTFEKPLASTNDITVYPRAITGNPRITIHEKNKNQIIAQFNSLTDDEYNKVFLTGLNGEQDTFDLHILNGSVQFDHIIDPSWWNTSLSKRKEFNITNAGSSVLTNFPAFVNVTYDTDMQTDFDDLRFVNGSCSSGQSVELDYEIDTYTASTNAHVWLRIPSLAVGLTPVCMYYGNSTTSTGANASEVWDSNYKIVHHLTGTSFSTMDDSTSNNADVTSEVGDPDYTADGRIAEGIAFDGTLDQVLTSTNVVAADADHSFEWWMKTTSSRDESFIGMASGATRYSVRIDLNGGNWFLQTEITGGGDAEFTTDITDGNWHHVALTYAGGGSNDFKMYVDGVADPIGGVDPGNDAAFSYTPGPIVWGFTGEKSPLTGDMDEIRYSDSSRSQDWVNQSYQMVANQGSFVAFGEENEGSSAPTTPTNITCDGSNNCNIVVDASVILNASGSTDPDSDAITYVLEAALENTTTVTDATNVSKVGNDGTTEEEIQTSANPSTASCVKDGGPTSCGVETGCGSVTAAMQSSNNCDATIDISTSGDSYMQMHFGNLNVNSTNITNGTVTIEYQDEKSSFTNQEFYCYNGSSFILNANPPISTTDTTETFQLNASCYTPSARANDIQIRFGTFVSSDSGVLFVDYANATVTYLNITGGGSINETNTTDTEYTDVNGDFDSVGSITVTVEVDSYDPRASVDQSTNKPDLALEMYNGSTFVFIGNFSLPSTYTGSGLNFTDVNFSLTTTDAAILTAWKTSSNQDFRIRGVFMDHNGSIADEIKYTNVFTNISGQKWTEVGNHTEATTFTWNTTALAEQTGIDLRTKAIDLAGSNTYSAYFTKGSVLNITHNSPPTTPTNILCNGATNCNIVVDASVILNASGSTDPNSDAITYVLEASLENTTTATDATDVSKAGSGGTPPANWWNSSWLSRKEINITAAGSALTDFPAYVNVTDDADMQADYDDLRFINGSCTSGQSLELDYELENYTASNAHVWVRIPSLVAGTTPVCMYYGNSGAANGENVTGVWDSNYVAVYHLSETDIDGGAGDIKDSTSNGYHATTTGMNAADQVPGRVDGNFDFDGADSITTTSSVAHGIGTGEFTMSAWVKPSTVGVYDAVMSFGVFVPAFYVGLAGGTNWGFYHSSDLSSGNGLSADTEYYLVAKRDGSTLNFYQDAVQTASSPSYSTSIPNNVFHIGFSNPSEEYMVGLIDEVRVSDISRSTDWINQSYQMVANQASFVTVGSEEVYSAGSSSETNTTYTNYTDVDGAFLSVNSVTVKVEVDTYDPRASVNQSTNKPDLTLEVYNGSTFVVVGNFSLPSTYTGSGLNFTDVNFSLTTTDSTILTAWETVANQDFRIRGRFMDFDESPDEINYTNVYVDISGKKWSEIGNHTEATTFNWNTAAIPEQNGTDLRARAIDLSGSNTYSAYFTKGSVLNISHGAGQPDLIPTDIGFTNDNPDELEIITINATVLNNGSNVANNILVRFFDGACGSTQINGNKTITQLNAAQSGVVNVAYTASPLGPHSISVCVDPADTISESIETNNNRTEVLNVKAYHDYYGQLSGNVTLDTDTNQTEYAWTASGAGSLYFTDSDATIDFTKLQALGRTVAGAAASNDFSDADTNLGMTGFNDSIQVLWAVNTSTPKQTMNFTVFEKTIANVPYINSTDNSNFITGIFWDTTKDSNGEYDTTEKEDLVFVGNINRDQPGFYGTYDYEVHVPSLLKDYNTTTSTIRYHVELR